MWLISGKMKKLIDKWTIKQKNDFLRIYNVLSCMWWAAYAAFSINIEHTTPANNKPTELFIMFIMELQTPRGGHLGGLSDPT